MNKYILTWAMKDPDEGFITCGCETIASKTACKKIVKSYMDRAARVTDQWTDQTYPYGEYTEMILSSGAELVLAIEPMRF